MWIVNCMYFVFFECIDHKWICHHLLLIRSVSYFMPNAILISRNLMYWKKGTMWFWSGRVKRRKMRFFLWPVQSELAAKSASNSITIQWAWFRRAEEMNFIKVMQISTWHPIWWVAFVVLPCILLCHHIEYFAWIGCEQLKWMIMDFWRRANIH